MPVGNVDARLGTAVDIKCRDRDGRIILIELKCGYNGVFEMEWPASKEWAWCTGNMNHLPANARTYSLIQLAWTWLLYNRSSGVQVLGLTARRGDSWCPVGSLSFPRPISPTS